jgi:hypothetical protein
MNVSETKRRVSCKLKDVIRRITAELFLSVSAKFWVVSLKRQSVGSNIYFKDLYFEEKIIGSELISSI